MQPAHVTVLALVDHSAIGEGATRVVCICLAGLVALAVVHKAKVLVARTASVEPLIQLTEWRRRHAIALLASAATVEAAIAVTLVAVPTVGLGAALVMLIVYSLQLRRLPAEESCDCMGNFLSYSRAAALKRNGVLGSVAAAAMIASVTGVAPAASVSQATVGAALIVAAFAVPVGLLPKLTRRAGLAASPRERDQFAA